MPCRNNKESTGEMRHHARVGVFSKPNLLLVVLEARSMVDISLSLEKTKKQHYYCTVNPIPFAGDIGAYNDGKQYLPSNTL